MRGSAGLLFVVAIALVALPVRAWASSPEPPEASPDCIGAAETQASYQAWLRETIEREVGAESNLGTARIVSISFSDDDPSMPVLTMVANDNLTIGMVKRGMWSDAIKVFRAVFRDSRASMVSIVWGRPLTDAFGNTRMASAMGIVMSRQTAQRIDWDNFITDNLPRVADAYQESF